MLQSAIYDWDTVVTAAFISLGIHLGLFTFAEYERTET